MAKKRTAEERAAHSRHHATWRKRVRAEADAAKPAEEMSERLKALYAGEEVTAVVCNYATDVDTAAPGPSSCDGNGDGGKVTTAPPLGPFADLRTSYASTAIAQPDTQISTGLSASSVPLPRPETAENDLGGFDASFFLNEDINPTLAGIQTGAGPGSASEVPPPQPQIQDSTQESVAPSLGSCQNSPLVPTASEQDSSTPLITAEDMLATAMPHFSPACRV
ncbi:hypothetical protein JCM8115_002634 [Rhodotorula mucilaginosa]